MQFVVKHFKRTAVFFAFFFFFWLAKEIMLIWSLAATKTVSRHYIFLFFPENIVCFFLVKLLWIKWEILFAREKLHIYPEYLDKQARANSADPDQMLQYAVPDLGPHCLPPIRQYLDKSREQNWHALILEHAMIELRCANIWDNYGPFHLSYSFVISSGC